MDLLFFDIWNQFKRLTTDVFSNFFSVFIVIIIRDAYRTKDVGPLLRFIVTLYMPMKVNTLAVFNII